MQQGENIHFGLLLKQGLRSIEKNSVSVSILYTGFQFFPILFLILFSVSVFKRFIPVTKIGFNAWTIYVHS